MFTPVKVGISSKVRTRLFPAIFPLVILAVCLFTAVPSLSSTVFAQFQNQQPDTIEALGSISGIVTDEDGKPLAGIRASAYENSGYFQRRASGALSDASGRYQVGGLRTGSYILEFEDPTGPYLQTSHNGSSRNSRGEDSIPVAGNHVKDIDVTLRQGGIITGKVDLHGHSALGSIELTIDDDTPYYSPPMRVRIDPATGEYQTRGLATGQYQLCAAVRVVSEQVESDIRDCYGTQTGRRADSTIVAVVNGGITSNIDISLGNPANYGTISGTTRGNDNSPLEEIGIKVEGIDTVRYTETDADGNYKILFVRPGDYEVTFRDASSAYLAATYADDQKNEAIAVQGGLSTEGIDVTMSLGGRITGIISASGGTLLNYISVYAYDEADSNGSYRSGTRTIDEYTGAFEIIGLPTGDYVIRARTSDFQPRREYISYYGAETASEAVAVSVTENEMVSNIDISIPISRPFPIYDGVVEGKVTASGEPLAGIRVNLHTLDPGYPVPIYYTETDSAGGYRIEGMRDSLHSLTFAHLSNLYATKSTQASQGSVNSFRTEPNSPITIDAEMVRSGSISGKIRDIDGASVTDVEIIVRQLGDGGEFVHITALTPDPGGGYHVDGLLPGQYLLSVLEPYSYPRTSEDERLLQQFSVEVFSGQTANAQDVVIGAGVPLALKIVSEPKLFEAIYIPFSTH